MANEFARNIQDKDLTKTRALTASDGTVTSTDFDLSAAPYKGENVELEITVPALTATELPNADTITMTVQSGTAATPTGLLFVLPVITGAGGVGYAGGVFRYRLPSNVARYVNVKFVTAGTSGDMSGKNALVKLLF